MWYIKCRTTNISSLLTVTNTNTSAKSNTNYTGNANYDITVDRKIFIVYQENI